MKGNNTVTFHGAVIGSNINIDSTLTNVRQLAGALPRASADQKQQLQQLVDELRQQLAQAPAANKEQAEAIAKLTEDLVTKANEQQPPALLKMAINNLKEAGTWVIDVLPKVPAAIAAITSIVGML